MPEARQRGVLWVESSEHKEAARAVEMLHVQLISAVIDPYSWKWVVVAAHHALSAFMVAVLDREAAVGRSAVLSELPGGWLKFSRRGAGVEPATEDRLPELYQRVKQLTGFPGSPDLDDQILALADSRQLLLGELPVRWEMNVRGLPGLLLGCLPVIEFLGWNPGHIPWEKTHLSDLARVKYLASLKVLDALERQYQPS